MAQPPSGYRPLVGSERRPLPGARRIGPAEQNEIVSVSVYVRPRPGAPPLPDMTHWMTPRPSGRDFLSHEEFARRHGAAQGDFDRVSAFARANDLTIDDVDSARRRIVLSGTVTQMDTAVKSPSACLFDEQIFVFWKSNNLSNEIYGSSSPSGVAWPPGVPINGSDRTPDSPVACVFLQHIFLFWKANDSSNRIMMTSSVNGHSFPRG